MLRSRQGVKWAAPSAIYKFMQPLPQRTPPFSLILILMRSSPKTIIGSLLFWRSFIVIIIMIITIAFPLYKFNSEIRSHWLIIIIIMSMASSLEIKTIIRVSLLWRSVWPSARPGAVQGKKILTPPLHHYCRASTWGQVEGCTSTFQVQDTW